MLLLFYIYLFSFQYFYVFLFLIRNIKNTLFHTHQKNETTLNLELSIDFYLSLSLYVYILPYERRNDHIWFVWLTFYVCWCLLLHILLYECMCVFLLLFFIWLKQNCWREIMWNVFLPICFRWEREGERVNDFYFCVTGKCVCNMIEAKIMFTLRQWIFFDVCCNLYAIWGGILNISTLKLYKKYDEKWLLD